MLSEILVEVSIKRHEALSRRGPEWPGRGWTRADTSRPALSRATNVYDRITNAFLVSGKINHKTQAKFRRKKLPLIPLTGSQ